ncbi:MAG: TonB-dependent receptor plug domain-containing protein [Opitutaceae bacterium]|nr:TonB-dependent receptor plug domain-containing protein [Opitutaceae bacterium]
MNDRNLTRTAAALAIALTISGHVRAQQTAAPDAGTPAPAPSATPAATEEEEGEMIVLTPFEVTASTENSYAEANTLAGTRLNTELRDLGNAVSVINSQFLKDTGATNNETVLQYAINAEVGNVYGNFVGGGDSAFIDESSKFTNPNQNTRVRGLVAADNARDYFLSDVPWDGATIDRVDLQRGPNSTLFGMGSPAGIINSGTKQAQNRNFGSAEVRIGSWGTVRGVLDLNREILDDELAVRFIAMTEDEKFKQDPAFEEDKRYFGALRYEPKFLKLGSARTVIKGTIETGEVDSNRPRSLPPIDMITPWFETGTYGGNYTYNSTTGEWTPTRTYNHLNRGTFNPVQLQDDNTDRVNHGQARMQSDYYLPSLGNFAQQFGGPMAYYDSSSSAAPAFYRVWEPTTLRGIGSDGVIDGGVGGIPYQRPGSVARTSAWAKNAQLPFWNWGLYKDTSVTNSSIFDFYNNLIDGPNKWEWQDFNVYNLSLTQTFFDDKLGVEAVYNRETYRNGQVSLLSGERQGLYIDVNSVYADGSPTGLNGEPFADGDPNPNVGRAFVSDTGQFGNNSMLSDKEVMRFTGFLTHDFARKDKNLLTRILGKHTVTGLWANDVDDRDYRSWQRYGTDINWDRFNANGSTPIRKFTDNLLTPNTVIYLGPSLSNRTSAAGANLPNAKAKVTVTSGMVKAFDSTWNSTVNPADAWFNDYYMAGDEGGESIQAENPANYVGYTTIPINIIDSEASRQNRDYLTTSARKTQSDTTSKAMVWQGRFWDNALIATASWRNDRAEGRQVVLNTNNSASPDGRLDLSPANYSYSGDANIVDVDSKSWMLVTHLSQVPGLDKLLERSPVDVTLFYNESENFQPAALRVDLLGNPLAPPSGETTDYGFLLETKDRKYSLKVTKYETAVMNGSSSAIGGAWFLGSSQAWAANWVNRFEYNWQSDFANPVSADGMNPSHWSYSQANYAIDNSRNETIEQAQAREASVVQAWRDWQARVQTEFPGFYEAWGMDYESLDDETRTTGVSSSNPSGFAVTEDSVSKGYEVEFNAQILRNWRFTLNAAKSEAVRTNIGGDAMRRFVAAYQEELNSGVGGVGDLRIWWGNPDSESTLYQWNTNVGAEWAQRALQEGTNVPELREWRVNAISTYDFSTGWLKGAYVGGGARYQSSNVIGYRPVVGETINDITFDMANPYEGDSETDFDLWMGYSMKLSDKIRWNIQLNIRNLTAGNELIPITTQPDGTPATYRIRPPRVWTLTNTFNF